MKRQKLRKLLLLISLLLFPITMWYMSPAVISSAMIEHILNGSFFVFLTMLVLSPFLGRIFCAYICPAGSLQDCVATINNQNAKQGKRNIIKYVIWAAWIIVLIILYILGENNVKINVTYMTDHGISVSEIGNYITYYGVLLLLVCPALIHGKRATCHYICWMAPFMAIGEKIGQRLHLPQLHIQADKEKCISCKKCNKECPMGLDVMSMIKNSNGCVSTECIQCGACVDNCPSQVLKYSVKAINVNSNQNH